MLVHRAWLPVLAVMATACGTTTTSAPDAGCPTCATPCEGVVCDRPPAGSCTSLTEAVTYRTPGSCSAGNCSYKSTTTTCMSPDNGLSQCAAGSCITSCDTGFALVGANCVKQVTAIVTGDSHACAIVNGGVLCWGSNTYGELGNGTDPTTVPYSAVPVPVIGMSVGVTALSAGRGITCAIVDGAVSCWGNSVGGSNPPSSTPSPVPGLTTGVLAVAAGLDHVCVVLTGGTVECWGSNDFGELGNNQTEPEATPVSATGLSGVTALAAGTNFTCSLAAGVPECWGSNGAVGDLGDGNMNVPVGVAAPLAAAPDGGPSTLTATAIAGGYDHACMIISGGVVDCWGNNNSGELGLGTAGAGVISADVPGPVVNLTGVTLLAQGSESNHVCALAKGKVHCWGSNSYGQLGVPSSPSAQNSPVPVAVPNLVGVTALATGGEFTCAIAEGKVMCFGYNLFGQLGNNSIKPSSKPVEVSGL